MSNTRSETDLPLSFDLPVGNSLTRTTTSNSKVAVSNVGTESKPKVKTSILSETMICESREISTWSVINALKEGNKSMVNFQESIEYLTFIFHLGNKKKGNYGLNLCCNNLGLLKDSKSHSKTISDSKFMDRSGGSALEMSEL
jgi:hypothetical protein